MRDILLKKLAESAQTLLKKDKSGPSDEPLQIALESTKKKERGDLASNIALVLSKRLSRSPIDIANDIVKKIAVDRGIIKKILVAPPGFINFYLSDLYWSSVLKKILSQPENYGRSKIGQDKRVLIEFVSANPTGPLHIGHGRCAALGDALANLLAMAGYKVFREYYINDAGRQIDILGKSLLARYNQLLGIESTFPEDGYKGEYVKQIAGMILEKNGNKYSSYPPEELIKLFSHIASKQILKQIRNDLRSFGVNFDSWFSEQSLFKQKKVSAILSLLREKGIVYNKDGAAWMKASALGDSKDRVVIKSTGEMTYFASDIAYHQDKYDRGFEKIIDIWGADHHGYVDRIKAILRALNHPENSLSVLLVQMVKLVSNGIQIDMSTRKGTFTALEEVIEEVGKDAARFFFLLRRHDSQLDFDIDLAKRQSSENPVYYCQYAHARICSIEKQADIKGITVSDYDIDHKFIKLDEEKEIIKKLDIYPEIIETAALSFEPHRLTFYLIELSTLFHKFYNSHRVITTDSEVTLTRLKLIKAVKSVVKSGLTILGVSAPERM